MRLKGEEARIRREYPEPWEAYRSNVKRVWGRDLTLLALGALACCFVTSGAAALVGIGLVLTRHTYRVLRFDYTHAALNELLRKAQKDLIRTGKLGQAKFDTIKQQALRQLDNKLNRHESAYQLIFMQAHHELEQLIKDLPPAYNPEAEVPQEAEPGAPLSVAGFVKKRLELLEEELRLRATYLKSGKAHHTYCFSIQVRDAAWAYLGSLLCLSSTGILIGAGLYLSIRSAIRLLRKHNQTQRALNRLFEDMSAKLNKCYSGKDTSKTPENYVSAYQFELDAIKRWANEKLREAQNQTDYELIFMKAHHDANQVITNAELAAARLPRLRRCFGLF